MTSSPLPLSSHAKPVDSFPAAAALHADLSRAIKGEVRFDRGSRALYSSDASNYRQIPIGVVIPRDADDVIAAVAVCRKHGAPVLPRGTGTSLAGQSCNVAVVLDFTKYMNRIVEINPGERFARVQPGVVCDTLRNAAERHKLTFGPDPATHSRCSLGGMIGNNSCGTHSLLAGKTVDNVEELRVLLYDGTELTIGATSDADLETIVQRGGRRGDLYRQLRAIRDRYAPLVRERFPDIPRRVSGYNLDQLLPERGFHVARSIVGTEGTCLTVLEAKVRLIPSPQHRVLVGLGYPDPFTAGDHVPEILEYRPIGLEGFEGSMIDALKRRGAPNLDLMPEGRGILLAEFGADDAASAAQLAQALTDRLQRAPGAPNLRIYSASEAKAVWKIRESGPRAASTEPGKPPRWEGWDDAAVAPQKLGPYLRELRKLLDDYGYDAAYYGHFGHGCIHMQISFDLQSDPGVRKFGAFVEDAADLVVRYGGSLSGEHGDGQARGTLLPKMFGPELMQAFREFKLAWDPDNRMNPNKGPVDPFPPTENLRLGADYAPIEPRTHFAFPDDAGSFATASLRCIGIGECRKHEGGTMCPSYLATMEEAHSTRGRAHMLFEMLQGEAIDNGWKNDRVKDALDLCLSCKACKAECPTNVDIATYRAEFLSHYYESRRRPLHAYAFGFIDRWAALASKTPALVQALHGPFSAVARRVLDLAAEREIPRFARESFQQWNRRQTVPHDVRAGSGKPVILWADTFNNYFRPQVARAALDVLRNAGFSVSVPPGHLCCGRPLYDFGFLTRAKEYLQDVLGALGPEIDAGIPLVVLEPSCASVFLDELRNLLPKDARADRLRRQTFLLSTFLARHAPDYQPPKMSGAALLHGHCHHKALVKMSDEEALLRRMGLDVRAPETGCCGMAGPFGYSKEKFSVAQAVGERTLLPAVRQAAPDAIVVADGFSCQEQIHQSTGRQPLHLAEVLQKALTT